jgi:hypothetical protein
LTSPPWRLTLRQFVARVQRDYGVSLRTFAHPMIGPRGPVRFAYLERTDLTDVFAVMLGMDEDEVLSTTNLRALCEQLRLPPEDFHLNPFDDD